MIIQKSPQIDLPERFCVAKSPGREGEEGHSQKFWAGVCRTNYMIFQTLFKTWHWKYVPYFRQKMNVPG